MRKFKITVQCLVIKLLSFTLDFVLLVILVSLFCLLLPKEKQSIVVNSNFKGVWLRINVVL
ncbi:mCG147377 [Mus musculus]|nr:mCG147377 [Mus musculus]